MKFLWTLKILVGFSQVIKSTTFLKRGEKELNFLLSFEDFVSPVSL